MNPANISRDEAQLRSGIIDPLSYDVIVDLSGRGHGDTAISDATSTFVSTSTVRFASVGEPTFIDIIAERIFSATLDGTAIDTEGFDGYRLGFEADKGEHELTIVAECVYSHTGEGLHRFVDPADDKVYLYTQFETADARRMYANFEQPDLKATFRLQVIAPQDWTVTSNSPTPEPTDDGDGFARWAFAPTKPLSTYLTALVAGEYHVVRSTLNSTAGEVPAALLCRQSVAEHLDADRIFDVTQKGFEVYEPHFDVAYPFGKYDTAFVPEYNAGAMENAGLVTVRDEYLFRSKVTAASYEARDNTFLHELAHMWFGDLVTMTWWDDLWLNESFAEWASHWCQEEIVAKYGGNDPWVGFATSRKGWAYRQDQLPTTHPIAADMVDLEAVEVNFDGITYSKGCSVLKQLVAFVGRDAFLAGVSAYLKAHSFDNATLRDLLTELEKASERELGWFIDHWLTSTGVNTIRADFDEADGTFARFDVVQSPDPRNDVLRNHKLAIGLYSLRDGKLVADDSLEVEIHGDRTPIAALAGRPVPDLVLLNDRDLSYVKVRLDDRSLATLKGHVGDIADPLARALVWATLWDMCRDAELSASEYVDLVVAGLGAETDPTTVTAQLNQARVAATTYTAPARRDQATARLVSGLAGLLKDAEPGSDNQLAFVNAILASINSPAGVELVQGWLDGEELPEGVEIDQDKRWSAIKSLARLGAVGVDEINAEAAKDQTIAGAEHAAGARAALKDAAAKADAWQLATESDSVTNAAHRQVCANFWQFGQDDELEGFRDKYLGVVDAINKRTGVWEKAGHAQVNTALLWLFPSVQADRAYLDEVQAWTTTADLRGQIARTLSENLDSAERALRCQELNK